MEKIIALSFIVVSMLFVACDDEEELLEYYKSQSKDTNLIGWWDIGTIINSEFLYWKFTNTNQSEFYKDHDNIKERDKNHYWYTKNNKLYILEYNESWMYGSIQDSMTYEIKDDTLFLNNITHAIKTTSPLTD